LVVWNEEKNLKAHSSRQEVADILERFSDLGLGTWEWDDFVSVPQSDPELEDARKTCLRVRQQFPAGAAGAWCSPEGMEQIRRVAQKLRAKGDS